MFPVIQIGRLALQSAGLILIIGVWVSYELAERQAPAYGLPQDAVFHLFVWMVGAGILGARLVYVALHLSIFLLKPIELVSLSPQLLNLPGGLACALIAAAATLQRQKISIWRALDALSLPLAVFLGFIGLSNLASGNAYGNPTALPWSIELGGTSRHPTQVYDILAALLITAVLTQRRKIFERWIPETPGLHFLVFLALASASQLIIEAFRAGSEPILGQFRLVQVIAWIALALSLWLFDRIAYPSRPDSRE